MREFKFFAVMALLLLGALAVACIFSSPDTAAPAAGGPAPAVGGPAAATGELRVTGPYTHENLEVYLVHGKEPVPPKREILTLEEALAQKKAVVHETGDVNRLAVENLTADADIFVQSGDIVQGGKQDRVLAMDILLSPKSGKVAIASFCVEQGRWGGRGQATGLQPMFRAFANESTTEFISSTAALPTPALKKAVKVAQAQGKVWQEVESCRNALSSNLGARFMSNVLTRSTSSLQLMLKGEEIQEAAKKYVDRVIGVIDDKPDVLGFAFAVNGKISSADVYGSHALCKKLWRKMLHASAVEAVTQKKDGAAKTEPVGTDSVLAFLTEAYAKKGKRQHITPRVALVRNEGARHYFFETLDGDNGSAWLHRNYLAK